MSKLGAPPRGLELEDSKRRQGDRTWTPPSEERASLGAAFLPKESLCESHEIRGERVMSETRFERRSELPEPAESHDFSELAPPRRFLLFFGVSNAAARSAWCEGTEQR